MTARGPGCVLVQSELETIIERATGALSEQEYQTLQSVVKTLLFVTEQLDAKQVEPNSNLSEAMAYMLRHWEKLTLFLRQPGAPLDNNIRERDVRR